MGALKNDPQIPETLEGLEEEIDAWQREARAHVALQPSIAKLAPNLDDLANRHVSNQDGQIASRFQAQRTQVQTALAIELQKIQATAKEQKRSLIPFLIAAPFFASLIGGFIWFLVCYIALPNFAKSADVESTSWKIVQYFSLQSLSLADAITGSPYQIPMDSKNLSANDGRYWNEAWEELKKFGFTDQSSEEEIIKFTSQKYAEGLMASLFWREVPIDTSLAGKFKDIYIQKDFFTSEEKQIILKAKDEFAQLLEKELIRPNLYLKGLMQKERPGSVAPEYFLLAHTSAAPAVSRLAIGEIDKYKKGFNYSAYSKKRADKDFQGDFTVIRLRAESFNRMEWVFWALSSLLVSGLFVAYAVNDYRKQANKLAAKKADFENESNKALERIKAEEADESSANSKTYAQNRIHQQLTTNWQNKTNSTVQAFQNSAIAMAESTLQLVKSLQDLDYHHSRTAYLHSYNLLSSVFEHLNVSVDLAKDVLTHQQNLAPLLRSAGSHNFSISALLPDRFPKILMKIQQLAEDREYRGLAGNSLLVWQAQKNHSEHMHMLSGMQNEIRRGFSVLDERTRQLESAVGDLSYSLESGLSDMKSSNESIERQMKSNHSNAEKESKTQNDSIKDLKKSSEKIKKKLGIDD
ncbi:MAG: hypothetical protein V4655_05835 [Bdellovibrionota bacterium]